VRASDEEETCFAWNVVGQAMETCVILVMQQEKTSRTADVTEPVEFRGWMAAELVWMFLGK
jgi:hypothetical protein